jgi:urea carboxylase-associated protein 2
MTSTIETSQQARQHHRERYEALRARGQGTTAVSLPPPTDPRLALLADDILHEECIPGGWYWTTQLARGEALRIVNTHGTSAVSMVAWSQADTSERLNTADTMKIQWSTGLRKGRLLFTEMGRVACSVIEDTSGAHDALTGPTTRTCVGTGTDGVQRRNSRDNFLLAAAKLGLSRRDVPACVNFFAPVTLDERGRFVWHAERRRPGDFVDLRAEMDLWVVLSNAGHALDTDSIGEPSPVDAIRFIAPPVQPDDPCRSATEEAVRAFAQTTRSFKHGDAR